MWRLFWQLYKKWLLVCAGIVIIVLGAFFAYFRVQYPKIRLDDIKASFEDLESVMKVNQEFARERGKIPRNQSLPVDVDLDLGLRTLQRLHEMVDSGRLEYQDFAELRYLNRLPLNRRPMGREYNRLFREINKLMDEKLAGRPDASDAAGGAPVGGAVSASPATQAAGLAPGATPGAESGPTE